MTLMFLPGESILDIHDSRWHSGHVIEIDLTPNTFRTRQTFTRVDWTSCCGPCWEPTENLDRDTTENRDSYYSHHTERIGMSQYEIPVKAIYNFFVKHGLPTRIRLAEMPDASTMRKIKYRANQLEERWDELMGSLSLDKMLAGLEGGVIASKTSKLRFGSQDDLKAGDTWLVDLSGIRLNNIPAEMVVDAANRILDETRFKMVHSSDYYGSALKFATKNSERNTFTNPVLSNEGIGTSFSILADGTLTMTSVRQVMADAKLIKETWRVLYRAILRNGMKAGAEAKPIPTHDTSANLQKYLDKRKRELTYNTAYEDAIETLPMAEHGTLSSRTWGIEVEAGGARSVAPPRGWDRKSDGSLSSAYYGDYDEDDEWYDEDEGDTDYDYEDDERWAHTDTGEFVSPILHSFHSKGLKALVTRLSHEPQNDSAGIHVHVGAMDLTARQIGGLVFAYEMIEPFIEESYRRERRDYCRNRNTDETIRILKASKRTPYKTYGEWSAAGGTSSRSAARREAEYIDPGDRYVSLNLCALDSHGTVEFRAMGPVYEYEHLIKWAHFCREMVNLAAKDVPSREFSAVKSFADLRAIFAKYGVETPAILFDEMLDHRLVESRLEYSEKEQQRALAEV